MCIAASRLPARYDDLITIRTRLMNVRESLLHFGYEIVRAADGKALAEGESVHIVVNSEFKRMHLPKKYMASFLKAAGKKLKSHDRNHPKQVLANRER